MTNCFAMTSLFQLKKTKSTQSLIYIHVYFFIRYGFVVSQGDCPPVQGIHRTTQDTWLLSYFSSSFTISFQIRFSKKTPLIQIKLISKRDKSIGLILKNSAKKERGKNTVNIKQIK